jgi:hypothetical protein
MINDSTKSQIVLSLLFTVQSLQSVQHGCCSIATSQSTKPTAAEQLPLYMGKVLPDTRCYQFLPVSARIVHQSYVALYDVTSSPSRFEGASLPNFHNLPRSP